MAATEKEKRKGLFIGAGSVSEKDGWGKAAEALEKTRGFALRVTYIQPRSLLAWGMDKKQINSPKMTLNFLIWVGGVFMLLLFALLAHFVWRLF